MATTNKVFITGVNKVADVETLEKFGPEFQAKVLALLIQDEPFVQRTFDIVDPAFFEANSRKWIAQTTLDYYKQYRKLPTALVFKNEIEKITSDILKVAVQNEIKNVARHRSDKDLDYVKDRFLQFCKNQTLKSAIIQSVDLLEQQEYDEIKVRIDKAMRAGAERNFGHDWKKDVEKRIFEDARDTIPTPWECINGPMGGGLAAGELGVIAAPSGAGKSWLLSALGAEAMKRGKKVLHFTLELNDTYTGLRYDTIFTKIETRKLKDNFDKIKKIVDSISGEIVIKYFPSKTITAHTLLAHVQQMEAVGFEPDLMIVDYGDLLRASSRTEARYLELGAIYEELRSLAGELYIPCWTASQTHRSSISDEVIQADKIAESYGKIMTADFVMSFSRTLDDKQTNTARVHIIKNRFGPDGITFPAKMNVMEGLVEVFDEHSTQGIQARQAMSNADNIVKKMLHKRLKDSQADTEANELG